ncbi:hypothetical protein SNEBB_007706, partial [Seison nebaliae]
MRKTGGISIKKN